MRTRRDYSDMVGQRFGLHTVIGVAARRGRSVFLRCRCDCGTVREVFIAHLRSGHTKGCGCRSSLNATKHGHAERGNKTPEYICWKRIKQRCEKPKDPGYRYYGARGIRICEEWRNDYLAFFHHVGPRPSPQHSIDRINNNGHYEPGNVRWATRSQQASNQRRSKQYRDQSVQA